MRVTLSQTVYRHFATFSPTTGGLAAPDSTPSGTVRRNGTLDGAVSVTVTNISTGFYKASFTCPSGYSVDDEVVVVLTWEFGSVSGLALWEMQVDSTVNSRSVAGDAMALTAGERTSLLGVFQGVGTYLKSLYDGLSGRYAKLDFLTGDAYVRLGAPAGASVSADIAAIKSDTGTLTTRLTSTRAGYLDNLTNLASAPPTAAEVTTAVWAAASRTLTDKTGFFLSTAPPTAAEIKTALEVTGGMLELTKTRVLLALPAAAPSNNSGLPLKSDLPAAAPTVTDISNRIERGGGMLATLSARFLTMIESYSGGTLWRFITGALSQGSGGSGGGSAGTQLVAMPTKLAIEGQACPKDRYATIFLQSGSSLAYGVQLVDANGVAIPTTGTTLSAKIRDGANVLVEDLAVEETLGSQGRLTVLIDTRDSGLVGVTYATLEVTRDNGASDVTTYPAQIFIER